MPVPRNRLTHNLVSGLVLLGLGAVIPVLARAAETAPPSAPAASGLPPADPGKPGPTHAIIGGAAPAQPAAGTPLGAGAIGLGAGAGRQQGPVEINATDGIEWQQSNRVYIARGNVTAKRGNATLYADTIMAYYRELPHSSQTEIWRVEADGHVKVTTPTQTVVGDHGVDDIDLAVVIMTGKGLKLTTPQDVVTARDSLEWYDGKQYAVARGDALAIRGERRLHGDTLVAYVVQTPGQGSHINRVDATGHVLVSGPNQVGTSDKGVYNVDSGIASLSGHVTLARGENSLTGASGVVDLNRGISRLLPGVEAAGSPNPGRVSGYLVPRQKPQPAGAEAR